MSGPIVRTGTNPKFWSNWDRAFGSEAADKPKAGKKKSSSRKKVTKASAKKKAVKKSKKTRK